MASAKWSKAPKLALYAGEGNGQGRTYVDPTDGDSRWPSVTTVLKHEDKSGLVQWAATKVAEKARDRPDIVMGDPDLVVQKLQYAHNDFRDERAEVGTGVHAWFQAQAEGSWDFPELDDEQVAMTEQLERWMEDYEVEILLVEFTVRGPNYMGTADIYVRYHDPLTGEVLYAIVDIKTSKNLWESHDMQLAALGAGEYILREVSDDSEGAYLRKGRVKAENSYWERGEMPHWDVLVKLHIREDFYDHVVVDPRLESLYYEKFQAYNAIGNIQQKMKEAVK